MNLYLADFYVIIYKFSHFIDLNEIYSTTV